MTENLFQSEEKQEKTSWDAFVNKARGVGKMATKPLWWVFDILNQPLYTVSNLAYAPADKKLKYAGKNLLHLATLGMAEAPPSAKREASEYILGEKESDFLSWDTLLRLGIDLVHDPLLYVDGIGALTKAGKFSGQTARMSTKLTEKGIKAGSDDIIRAFAKNNLDDITRSIAKKGDDLLRKEWDNFINTGKNLQIDDTFKQLKRFGKTDDEAVFAIRSVYERSSGIWKEARKFGEDSEDFLRQIIYKNPQRFAHRNLFRTGVPFVRKTYKGIGKKLSLKMSRNANRFARLMSKMPSAKYIKKVKEALGSLKTSSRITDPAHELSKNLSAEWAMRVTSPSVFDAEDIMTAVRINKKEAGVASGLLEMMGKGERLTRKMIMESAERMDDVDGDKIAKIVFGTKGKKGFKQILKEKAQAQAKFFKQHGFEAFDQSNVDITADILGKTNDYIEKTLLPNIKRARKQLDGIYDTSIPKALKSSLKDAFGVEDVKDMINLTDDNIDDFLNMLKTGTRERKELRKVINDLRGRVNELYHTVDKKPPESLTAPLRRLSKKKVRRVMEGYRKAVMEASERVNSFQKFDDFVKSGKFAKGAKELELVNNEMQYLTHSLAPEIYDDAPLTQAINASFKKSATAKGGLYWGKHNMQRTIRATDDAIIKRFEDMFGGKIPPKIEKILGDYSVELTAREANMLIRGKKTWGEVLEEIKQINPERYNFLKNLDPELKGTLTNRVRDLIESKNLKRIDKLFDEDPSWMLKEGLEGMERSISSEAMVKHLVRNQGRTRRMLVEMGETAEDIQANWEPVQGIYAEVEDLLPDSVKKWIADSDMKDEMLGTIRGNEVMVPRETKEYLLKMLKTSFDPARAGAIRRNVFGLYHKLRNIWVFTTLARPGFHVRNWVSGLYMNAQYGILNPVEYITSLRIQSAMNEELRNKAIRYGDDFFKGIPAGTKKAISKLDDITIDSPIYGKLTGKDIWTHYNKRGVGMGRIVSHIDKNGRLTEQGMKRFVRKYGTGPFKRLQMRAGNLVEDNLRLTNFIHHLKTGKNLDSASRLAKLCHYDYSDLSPWDRKIRKVFPFWSWTRKTIPAQFRVMLNKPQYYMPGVHMLSTQHKKQLPDELLPEYMADMGGIEMFKDKNGEPHFFLLGSLLPIGELQKLAIKPKKLQQNVLEMLVPIIKEPIQQIANYDFFRERKIKEWEGQTGEWCGFQIPIRLRHAGFNVAWLNTVSRFFWKDKPGRPAPSFTEKTIKTFTGLNLKPIQVDKLKARHEYKSKMKIKELVTNFRRTLKYQDTHNAGKIMKNLDQHGYDVRGLIQRELENNHKPKIKRFLVELMNRF